jgi:alpha-1,3-fucosyltransferase 10
MMLDRLREPCSLACELTTDRGRLAEADAVVFHVPTLDRRGGLPARRPGQRWVAWSMESAVNYPALADPRFLRQFDLTMTYEQTATVWCPYLEPGMAEPLLRAPGPKTEPSPVTYFRSSPVDRSGRGRYAFELMRRVKVDSYGAVLRNRALTEGDRGRDTRLATFARYKFTLALENSIAPDYVTEKFFEPLMAGSVPVYLGAPNADDFAPGDRCFVDASHFDGPAALAAHLNRLDRDAGAYAEYHVWRRRGLRPRFRAFLDSLRESAFCRLCRALSPAGHDART